MANKVKQTNVETRRLAVDVNEDILTDFRIVSLKKKKKVHEAVTEALQMWLAASQEN